MISYYELLGLIKEGKQPDKVWCFGHDYVYDGCEYYSNDIDQSLVTKLESHYTDNGLIREKVIEIIEDKPIQDYIKLHEATNEQLIEEFMKRLEADKHDN